MSEYHPDKCLMRSGAEYTWARAAWLKQAAFYDVKRLDGFKKAFVDYLDEAYARMDVHNAAGDKHRDRLIRMKDKGAQLNAMINTPLYTAVQLRLCIYQVISDYLVEQYDPPSYSRLVTDNRFKGLMLLENADSSSGLSSDENHATEVILRHALKTYQMGGEKMYFVSQALEQELRNTNVKGLPVELFHLPYPTVYLRCPEHKPFMIYNGETGWHNVEGMYLVEDEDVVPRTLRIVLTGLRNDNSIHEEDDALYHWSLYLEEGSTIDECIQKSFAVGEGTTTQVRVLPQAEDEEPQVIESTAMPVGSDGHNIFMQVQPELLKAFKYALNVILYATHPDSEVVGFNSSTMYENLRGRAMKAQGTKRKKLFKRANDCKGHDRVMLGGTLVIDRGSEGEGTEGRSAGAKHTVRTYVGGHWQHFWVGKGRTKQVYKRVRPYWKGPKDGHLSKKAHKVGK